jgi:hypothetical protein
LDGLTRAIAELDQLEQQHKEPLSQSVLYKEALKQRDDCQKAKNNPKKYLQDKGLYAHFFDASGKIVPH